jgi:predicted ATPase
LDGVLIGLRTRDLLLSLMRARCRITPVVTLLEDLHWIDGASEELLSRLVATKDNFPLLIIHTCRPEYRAPWKPHQNVNEIRLEPLSAADTSQIIRARFGVQDLPRPLTQLVTDKAEGNPLFAEEITSFLVERGMVRPNAAGVEYDSGTVAAALPASVQGLLSARMDRLAQSDRALL